MKKIIAFIISAICILSFAGCSDNTQPKDVDLNTVLTDINTACEITDAEKLSDVKDLSDYYLIDAKLVSSFAGEINTGSLTEIVLVKAADEQSAKTVAEKLEARLQSKGSEAASYSPENYEIIKSCKVTTDGVYVSMIVTEKADKALEIYNAAIK